MIWYLCGTVLFIAVALYLRRTNREKTSPQKAAMVAAIGCFLGFLLAVADAGVGGENYVERNAAGEGNQEKEYILNAGKFLKDYSWNVIAEEQKLTEEEKEEVFKEAQTELEQRILGENESLEKINRDLSLPTTLQDGVVEVEYEFSDYQIFYPDGTVRKLPEKATIVTVSAEMECQEETFIYEFGIQVVPLEKGEAELLVDKIKVMLEQENQKSGEDKLALPKEVDGVMLSWEQKTENRSFPVAVLGIIAAGCILASEKEGEKKKQVEREWQLRRDYPEILGKFILLMGAGMNPAMAWKRIATAYQKRREERRVSIKPAYEEMVIAVHEMQEGIGEIQAYQNFGERCAISEYRKLSAILVQNVRKGNAQVQRVLEEEKVEAYEKQKARVKTAGEEAGTKLLFPMLLMLLVVLVIIMVPAGMSMKM